jgi:hypothetical protein
MSHECSTLSVTWAISYHSKTEALFFHEIKGFAYVFAHYLNLSFIILYLATQ